MSTIDDKLLGEKQHYYCSSDEENDNDTENDGEESERLTAANIRDEIKPHFEFREREAASCNTGPKGVIKDWQRYKQIEAEKREKQEKEKLSLIKKLSLTCRSYFEDEKCKQKEQQVDDEIDKLLNENDSFLKEYMQKRMEEMIDKQRAKYKFGKLEVLHSGIEFLDTIDKKYKDTNIICHIFSNDIKGCEAMNGCLSYLASQYPHIKFCCIEASAAGMSKHFERSGVPALLVYKNGNLLGNFVRLTDEFGDDFFATDVEAFLVEHGFLPDPSLIPEIVKGTRVIKEGNCSDSESE
ncbi:hypothetical protein B4U79_05942 [Dinothrombium tinctorium]|uniref:Phosducin domain-containing protein n=1 Tax=Dinothrombium tinctorium TaxID=1965070 RepID=A0A3S3Q8B6_9ACAR|nr:hypothetical protein B4U79_05942 [Dinothrombium tinctorium]